MKKLSQYDTVAPAAPDHIVMLKDGVNAKTLVSSFINLINDKDNRIEFGTELSKTIVWDSTRIGQFGTAPHFQAYQYSGSGMSVNININYTIDESSPTTQYVFDLPGVAGYILIK